MRLPHRQWRTVGRSICRSFCIKFEIGLFDKGGALHRFSDAPFDYNGKAEATAFALADGTEKMVGSGQFFATGYAFDLLAVLIAFVVTAILVRGVSESAFTNAIMVSIKVAVVLFVIVAGVGYINPSNWKPFAPYGYGGMTFFGQPLDFFGGTDKGMMAGAAGIIFAYLGFDAVSTQAEEAKNPKRDLPIGIIGSLMICTVLYIAVSAVLTAWSGTTKST